MAKQCTICKKRGMMAGKFRKLRGKYSRVAIKKRKYPNLQWLKLVSGKRVLACVKCIKAREKIK